MAIPERVKIKNRILPPEPGVYFMKDADGKILYIGKATSLRSRVGSYFTRELDVRIAAMVTKIARIDYEVTPTAIEALMMESRLIKKHQPPYNVMEKDDKSWVRLAFTKEDFPRPVLVREHDLERDGDDAYIKTFGPFKSSSSIRSALDALRPAFPWTTCRPKQSRPCFYRHLKLCPGVCDGTISRIAYGRIIRQLIGFFEGHRDKVIATMEREMKKAAKEERFEEAASWRNRLRALLEVRDLTVLKQEEKNAGLLRGRIEGYDISNISGTDSVGSMVVFEDAAPKKGDYRVFHIKSVVGPDDFASMGEVIERRLARAADWPLPELFLIDGGAGQVAVVREKMKAAGVDVPIVGLAKGFDRKQDVPVFDRSVPGFAKLIKENLGLLKSVRDEAHRFAVAAHRKRRAKRMVGLKA